MRDHAIDVIRGYCIVSMVAAHLAGASILAAMFHVVPKFDGASGFVLLSGLVLGMVQKGRVNRSGLKAIQLESLRRLVVIYIAQIALVVLGVTAASQGWKSTNFPNMSALSPIEVVAHALMMTLAPPGGDVLRLYVFMLALAMGAYVLLVRGRWVVTLLVSVAVHIVGQVLPSATSFSPFAEQSRSAGWAGWQLLFISALVLGWYWKDLGVAGWLDRNAFKVMAACVAVMAITLLLSFTVPAATEEVVFSKYTFPIGRILVAYSVVMGLYVALRWLMRKLPAYLFRPLAIVGSRSLDSYVIQAIVVVSVYGFHPLDSGSILAQFIAVATLLGCWMWGEFRNWNARRRLAPSP